MNSVDEKEFKNTNTAEFVDSIFKIYKRNLRFKRFRRFFYLIIFYFIPSIMIGIFWGLKCQIIFGIAVLLPTLIEIIELLINNFTRYLYE